MRIILIHGKDKDSSDVWYPWVGEMAARLNLDFISPDMPRNDKPVLDEWLAEIDKLRPGSDDVLIGHSRGGMAIMRYLERNDVTVDAAVLIAANNPAIEDGLKDSFYLEGEYRFEEIKNKARKFVVIHSRDDPWVPFEAGQMNVKGLDAHLVALDGRRHFGKDANGVLQMQLPELEEVITDRLNHRCRALTNKECRAEEC